MYKQLLVSAGAAAAAIAAAAAAAPESAHRIVYVAPNASGAVGDGSFSNPFTLAAAQRSLRGRAADATVMLRGGDYLLVREPLVLTEADGGAIDRPVTYQSFPGERARLLGGIEVPVTAFQPVSEGHVPPQTMEADLRSLGVHNASMLGGDSTRIGQDQAELFMRTSDGSAQPLQLAQDPNPHSNGTWQWAGYSEILAGNRSWFILADDAHTAPAVHLKQWSSAVQTGLRLYGHWGDPYDDMKTHQVQSIVPIAGDFTRGVSEENVARLAYNITLKSSGSGSTVVTPGQRFVAVDALNLLDAPGEYWIDRASLKLYLYPPVPLHALSKPAKNSRENLSFLLSLVPGQSDRSSSEKGFNGAAQGLIELHGVSHVRLINLTIAANTRSLLIANASTGLTVEDCYLVGAGGDCASIQNVADTKLLHNTIAYCGGTGLTLTGGSWYPGDDGDASPFTTPELPTDLWVSANVSMVNCELHNWARWQRIPNHPGVSWSGVGHTIHGCRFENGPSPAVINQGSLDFTFEMNEVSACPYEYNDMGAYYHGGSAGGYQYGWTQTGNHLLNNTWRHIKFVGRVPQTTDYNFTWNGLTTQAIYLDDGHSGYSVTGNHFHDVEMGVVLGGGRRHTVLNNHFSSCGRAGVHIDNRGMNWAHELCGCQCSFGTCKPGCIPGGAIGPGLNETDWTVLNRSNFPGVHGYPPFRFEQGVRKLRCAGPQKSPPCTTRLPWLADLLDDITGGGLCAPAHNLVTNNSFSKIGCSSPWQLCGFIDNASDFTLECSLHASPDLPVVSVWGSHAEGNWFV